MKQGILTLLQLFVESEIWRTERVLNFIRMVEIYVEPSLSGQEHGHLLESFCCGHVLKLDRSVSTRRSTIPSFTGTQYWLHICSLLLTISQFVFYFYYHLSFPPVPRPHKIRGSYNAPSHCVCDTSEVWSYLSILEHEK